MKREEPTPSPFAATPVDLSVDQRAVDRRPAPLPPPVEPTSSADEADMASGHVDPLIDQVDNLHAFARTGLVGNTVGACVIVALYARSVPLLTMTVWGFQGPFRRHHRLGHRRFRRRI